MSEDAYTVFVDNRLVLIRPTDTHDVAMAADFVRKLSSRTKHYRFFGAVKELSARQIEQMCHVDGYHSMAFVATISEQDGEVEIGVCRYSPGTSDKVRELAVTVADEWQHTGLAQIIMRRLVAWARQHGIRELYSVDLADDQCMRQFASDFGMVTRRDPGDANQLIHSLPL